MLTKLQIGYLAGLLDGEGQVSIIKNVRNDAKARKRGYELRPQVAVSQRRRILLDTVLKWAGPECGHIGRTGAGGRYYFLRFRMDWLRRELPRITPHLILKRRQAEIVMEFLSFPARIGRNGAGDEAWARRDLLRAECKALNLDRTNAET